MISVQHVSKEYAAEAGPFRALDDVSLELGAGQLVAVVGRSGSGKSTLLNLLGGLDTASSGTVRVSGVELQRLDEAQLAAWRGRHVGFVFQSFQLLPTLTAAENVMLPMDFVRALPPRRRRPRALELLGRVGVAEQADKLPAMLSGGQQQRVAIARALANDPELLLTDEPTGNLDSATAAQILQLLGGLGKTVVLVTHERALRADRVVELADGRVLR